MRMIKCADCGSVFSEDELIVEERDESRGEFWGIPCEEHMVEWHCPHCDSDDVDEYYGEEEE